MHITKLPKPTDPAYGFTLRVDCRPEGGDVYERSYHADTSVHWAIRDLAELSGAWEWTPEPGEFTLDYDCSACGQHWSQVWDAIVNDTCPACGLGDIEPSEVADHA